LDAIVLVRVARFLGVAPWELANKPAYWLYLGQTVMDVEQAQHEKKVSRKGKK
jgi:hypothetical protein